MNQRTLVICGTAALGTGIVIGGGILIMKLVRRAARCCRDEGNPYEADQMVDQYMGFHYAPPPDYISYPFAPKDSFEFPVRCAELCKKHRNEELLSRALDIGCAVGRSTFELATDFHQVIGIDYSNAFIKKANTLAQMGRSTYKIKVEGDLTVELEANVDPNIDRTRVIFEVGDACALRKDLGQFGMVLAANLICRLPDPKLFLHRLNELVLPGGIVVITSPYTWLDDYTPKDKWIGGYMNDEDVPVEGFDGLKDVLSPHFVLLEEENFPFLIRETIRKHQWTVAHATVWMKKIPLT